MLSAAEQLKLLHDLQQIDQQIMEIERFRNQGPQHIAQLEAELKHYESLVAEKEQLVQQHQGTRREKERELEEHEAQIRKNNERMSAVKTNEEYHAIQRENEKQKSMIGEIEDHLLQIMDEIDSAALTLKKAKERYTEAEKAHKAKVTQLKEQLEKVNRQVNELIAQRDELVPSIESSLLIRYDKLRKQTGGIAVVRVIKRTCMGCRVNVPPQVYNLVIKNEDIHTCPFCYRILYYDPAADDAEAALG